MRGLLLLLILPMLATAQSPNPIITAFPSLRIPSSSRGLAMGDCGTAGATSNDQLYYNAAKIAFTQYFHQVGISYTPWLAAISNDSRFMNLSYIANVSTTSALGISLNYLRLGNVQTRNNNGALVTQFNANEWNILTSYALQLSENASIAVGLRFIANQPAQVYDPVNFTAMPKSIFSASADLSYYHKFSIGEEHKLEIGMAISNLGPKVRIDVSQTKTFLPTNLSLGASYSQPISSSTTDFTFELNVNKLLAPTQPEYDNSGNVISGKDPNRSILNALFSSFADAPGGFKEELREIRLNAGAEIAFQKQFFLRAGISLESKLKGNRKFLGAGVGYRGIVNDQSWGFYFHWLTPFGIDAAISPFQNSWGFNLSLNMRSFE